MAAAGIGNSAGTVTLFDFGTPHILPGYVRNEIISGGVFVFGSTATGVVSSGTNSFSTGSMLFSRDASGLQFNGIALQTTTTSGPIAVAMNGVFILQCDGSVFGGQGVMAQGRNSVVNLGSFAVPVNAEDGASAGHKIGRAICDAASGGYAVIYINP